ncbi:MULTISPECIES: GNAT family N-acetyltransferase [unclassified Streptomyces]|uniref:GNAT family N-acetyltransferase n=1 Tax=unclassified Streptomyces TaxID=2593676 RepID=UPI00081DD65E|nr:MULTISPECIES: GNAT family N-acetyltransferase [unclassified Streptomyces]SCF90710.1 Ribosomal protein S18 acetylase RimI [Streptomyces sp. MnatMP-M17]
MIIRTATTADVPRLKRFRTAAAAWLAARGSDQWSTPYPDELLLASVKAGHVYLVHDNPVTDPIATVTLDRQADPVLWTDTEAREAAFYVHKLTLAQPGGGTGLGARLLDWCGDRAARAGATWLRLDAWTTNTRLHAYYQNLGFHHVRTVDAPEAYGSGWAGQRRAALRVTTIEEVRGGPGARLPGAPIGQAAAAPNTRRRRKGPSR